MGPNLESGHSTRAGVRARLSSDARSAGVFTCCVLIFLAVALVYNATAKTIPVSDTEASNFLPWLMVKKHTISFDYLHPGDSDYMYYPHDSGHYSAFPPGAAFAALPVYVVPSLFIDRMNSFQAELLAKISSSLMMALATVFIFLTALELIGRRGVALLTAAVFAFATCIFSMASQMLLTNTGAVLFVSLGLLLLARGNAGPGYVAGAGFSLAYAGFCQPVNFFFLLLLGVYVLARRARNVAWYALGALPVLLLMLAYNFVAYGSPFQTGEMLAASYILNGSWEVKASASQLWSTPAAAGLLNNLFSPSRGIFTFSPVLLFSFVGLYMVLRMRGRYMILGYGFIGCVAIMLASSLWYDWYGGNGFGYRTALGAVPVLCLQVGVGLPRVLQRKAATSVFAILLAASIFVQLVGYLSYDGGSWEARNLYSYDGSAYEQTDNNIWSLENNQIVWETKNFTFYKSGAWQTGDYPSRETVIEDVVEREGDDGEIRIGVRTSSPRIARLGITVSDGNDTVLTRLSRLVPRGEFVRWTSPFRSDTGGLRVHLAVFNVGVEDEYGFTLEVAPNGG